MPIFSQNWLLAMRKVHSRIDITIEFFPKPWWCDVLK